MVILWGYTSSLAQCRRRLERRLRLQRWPSAASSDVRRSSLRQSRREIRIHFHNWRTTIHSEVASTTGYVTAVHCCDSPWVHGRQQTTVKTAQTPCQPKAIRIRISGLIRIRIRIRMSAGSLQKCCGFYYLVSVIHVVKFRISRRWLYEKC